METTASDRRLVTRWPVRLLARCLWESRGHPCQTDVEVRNVHQDGLCLEHPADPEGGPVPSPRPGWKLVVRGFFYDERGDKPLSARVCWVRTGPDGSWSAGARFTDEIKDHSTCFRDFLRVVRSENA